jgi:hypothetical protein
MMWKDTLDPRFAGASRTSVPIGTPGSIPDYYGTPQGRMDVVGFNSAGQPIISGSSEAQPGAGGPAMVPSPGFMPVDPGQYGANPFFAGRGSALQAAAPGGALGSYQGSSSSQLQALLRALQSLTSLDAASLSGALGGGGLKIAE